MSAQPAAHVSGRAPPSVPAPPRRCCKWTGPLLQIGPAGYRPVQEQGPAAQFHTSLCTGRNGGAGDGELIGREWLFAPKPGAKRRAAFHRRDVGKEASVVGQESLFSTRTRAAPLCDARRWNPVSHSHLSLCCSLSFMRCSQRETRAAGSKRSRRPGRCCGALQRGGRGEGSPRETRYFVFLNGLFFPPALAITQGHSPCLRHTGLCNGDAFAGNMGTSSTVGAVYVCVTFARCLNRSPPRPTGHHDRCVKCDICPLF